MDAASWQDGGKHGRPELQRPSADTRTPEVQILKDVESNSQTHNLLRRVVMEHTEQESVRIRILWKSAPELKGKGRATAEAVQGV